jgi:hypothetical protein
MHEIKVHIGKRGSVIAQSVKRWDTDWTVGASIPLKEKLLLFLHIVQTGPG